MTSPKKPVSGAELKVSPESCVSDVGTPDDTHGNNKRYSRVRKGYAKGQENTPRQPEERGQEQERPGRASKPPSTLRRAWSPAAVSCCDACTNTVGLRVKLREEVTDKSCPTRTDSKPAEGLISRSYFAPQSPSRAREREREKVSTPRQYGIRRG